jgi:hypothetical protein
VNSVEKLHPQQGPPLTHQPSSPVAKRPGPISAMFQRNKPENAGSCHKSWAIGHPFYTRQLQHLHVLIPWTEDSNCTSMAKEDQQIIVVFMAVRRQKIGRGPQVLMRSPLQLWKNPSLVAQRSSCFTFARWRSDRYPTFDQSHYPTGSPKERNSYSCFTKKTED